MQDSFVPEHGEDVTRTGCIFSSIDASTKLTQRLQDVHVVAAHKVLCQVHYGHHESLLEVRTKEKDMNLGSRSVKVSG